MLPERSDAQHSTERAVERCARQAGGLLDDQDALVVLPGDGHTLVALLAYAGHGRALHVVVPAALAGTNGGKRVQERAAELGITCVLVADLAEARATMCLAEAQRVALDGSATLDTTALTLLPSARTRMPVYLLAPEGPDRHAPNASALEAPVAAPELINAIITSRGIYRPAMIARFLDDRDAPLDVIPLLS